MKNEIDPVLKDEIAHVFEASKRKFAQAVEDINAQIMAADEPRPKWTQDEAIAFECARECITHLMAICTGELHNGEPAESRRAELEAELSRLARERSALHVADQTNIARIRTEYGARIRSHRKQGKNNHD